FFVNNWKMPLKKTDGLATDSNPQQNHIGGDTRSSSAPSENDADLFYIQRIRTNSPPVVFLKTHRTGGSTVQNLLFRMGERDGATFAFPHHTYHFNYPQRFRAELVDKLPSGSSQYDILCSHMRLDVEQLKKVMSSNAIFITILREPVQTFESVFSYYSSSVPAFASAKKAKAETSGNKSALSVFLDSPQTFWDPKEFNNGLGKNPMSFDLGLNSRMWNSSWLADLTLLEEAFQLVMIAEHFDESLVLLGALLKLELEELAYVRLNSRSAKDITLLDEVTKVKIRTWNNLDVLLYDFFLQVFWEKAGQYGLERLRREVGLLRASTERIRQKCVAKSGVPPDQLEDLVRPSQIGSATILGHQVQRNLTKQDQGFCTRLVLHELQYHAHLYYQQYARDMGLAPTQ
uniref:Galactose-3-O-sulfotransferase 2 n=1 Tax=Sphaeramia orbicularis TaxID=375764 RepID=A0A673BIK9_9TELE